MSQTYPCADTRCDGRTLVDGTPCPDCKERIKRENTPHYVDGKTNLFLLEKILLCEHKKKGKGK